MLKTSPEYDSSSLDYRDKFANGCGPGWFPRAFRDGLSKIFGHNVREACAIHDFDYAHESDRLTADKRFYENLKILCKDSSEDRGMIQARMAVAGIYYLFVQIFGKFSYKQHSL